MSIQRLFGKEMIGLWTRNLVITSVAFFLMRFGEGLLGGARMNFFVDTIGLNGGQVLLLEGIREVPGLLLVFIAALTMHLPLSWRAAASAAILGLGFMAHALVHSYVALLAVAVAASFGLHGYQPIHPALGMSLANEKTRGRVLGVLTSVGSLAGITGMGAIALTSNVLRDISLRWFYVVGGVFIIVSAVFFLRLSKDLGATQQKQPRLVFRRKYWLYYTLNLLEGARKEVLGSFCTLMLVEQFGWKVWQISPLLFASATLSLFLAPYLGGLVDRFGPRNALAGSYAVLAMACVGYAVIPNAMILAGLYVIIRLAQIMHLGINVYAHQIAPAEEVTPTLSAGVSVNHISSVAMPLLFGVLVPIIGYSGVYLGSAVIIAISVVFALMIRTSPQQEGSPEPALAS
ncbi:MAG TPA: MFS transporter [Chloroflexi bacterium]|nr:MFS transporter [Chloroflexota bacterium]